MAGSYHPIISGRDQAEKTCYEVFSSNSSPIIKAHDFKLDNFIQAFLFAPYDRMDNFRKGNIN